VPQCGDVANHDPPIVAESLHRGTRFDNNVLQGIQEDSLENAINTHTKKNRYRCEDYCFIMRESGKSP
jgi:hypothetical protein